MQKFKVPNIFLAHFQGFTFALEQDSGLDRKHSELVIRELAKFHAISFCMKKGSNANMLEAYPYLTEDSLYRESTEGFTKRTITPVMASLAELLRNTEDYEDHYDWFVELARNFHSVSLYPAIKIEFGRSVLATWKYQFS